MGDHPPIVLATPAWSLNGPNVFSLNLARGLRARQIPAQIVVTRPDWVDAKPLATPADIPLEFLPVQPFLTLRARWKAMLDYLESRAPCIYVPNYDFGHSCISPRLSDRVAIVGIVHSDDPQHYEHVMRLGKYWNAIVAVSPAIADESRKLAPALADRVVVIPYGVTAAERHPKSLDTSVETAGRSACATSRPKPDSIHQRYEATTSGCAGVLPITLAWRTNCRLPFSHPAGSLRRITPS